MNNISQKLLPPYLVFISVAVMFILNIFFPITPLLHGPITLSGIAISTLGTALTVSSAYYLKKNQTNLHTFSEPNKLIITGSYRFSRNPIYLGFLLLLLGLAIFLGSLSSFLVVIIFTIIADRWYIAFEEQAMLKKFDNDYAAYTRTTRRWI